MRGNLTGAKEKAAEEGKLYFVQFTASWCAPCLLMDETTYTDPRITGYIDKNYVPVKIDVDDFDGIAYKKKYNITMLPAIIIFNSKGDLLAHYQESFAPSKFLKVLEKHNIPRNRTTIKKVAEVKPITPVAPAAAPSVDKTTVHRPPLTPTKRVNQKPTTSSYSKADGARSDETKTFSQLGLAGKLYQLSVFQRSFEGYSVQTGVFADFENVLHEVAKLEKQFKKPVLVYTSRLGGKTVFKILLGTFDEKAKANQFKKHLSSQNLDGFVKDLTSFDMLAMLN